MLRYTLAFLIVGLGATLYAAAIYIIGAALRRADRSMRRSQPVTLYRERGML